MGPTVACLAWFLSCLVQRVLRHRSPQHSQKKTRHSRRSPCPFHLVPLLASVSRHRHCQHWSPDVDSRPRRTRAVMPSPPSRHTNPTCLVHSVRHRVPQRTNYNLLVCLGLDVPPWMNCPFKYLSACRPPPAPFPSLHAYCITALQPPSGSARARLGPSGPRAFPPRVPSQHAGHSRARHLTYSESHLLNAPFDRIRCTLAFMVLELAFEFEFRHRKLSYLAYSLLLHSGI
jgi:hypothetical protein